MPVEIVIKRRGEQLQCLLAMRALVLLLILLRPSRHPHAFWTPPHVTIKEEDRPVRWKYCSELWVLSIVIYVFGHLGLLHGLYGNRAGFTFRILYDLLIPKFSEARVLRVIGGGHDVIGFPVYPVKIGAYPYPFPDSTGPFPCQFPDSTGGVFAFHCR